jgi:hypothetical protein
MGTTQLAVADHWFHVLQPAMESGPFFMGSNKKSYGGAHEKKRDLCLLWHGEWASFFFMGSRKQK